MQGQSLKPDLVRELLFQTCGGLSAYQVAPLPYFGGLLRRLVMLIVLIAAIILFHVVVFYGLITRRFNAMYAVAAMFTFTAPVSTAMLAHSNLVKQGRVYCTVLLITLGLLVFRAYRFGTASVVFAGFATVYFLAAAWSDFPADGILYKGLFGAVFLSGLLLAHSTRSVDELQSGVRILTLAGAAFAIFVLLELVRNPAALTHVGRLMAFGMNPNRIGQEAASMLIMATFLALHESHRLWKGFGYGLAGVLTIIILYTGSRGAVGMALIGGIILFLPVAKRPGVLAVAAVILGSALYFGLGMIGDHSRDRLGRVTLETRDMPWTYAIEQFREKPVFGQGWVYNIGFDQSASTRNMHSIYMQTLAELGLVGITLMILAMVFVAAKAHAAWRVVVEFPEEKRYSYLMIGLLTAVFAHGFIESSTFVGAAANAMFLGFSIGLVDRLPQLVRERAAEREVLEEPELESMCGAVQPAY